MIITIEYIDGVSESWDVEGEILFNKAGLLAHKASGDNGFESEKLFVPAVNIRSVIGNFENKE